MKIAKVMSHRGDLNHGIENTLTAIQAAADGGIKVIECDIQVNAAGLPVLLHDDNLKRIQCLKQSIFDNASIEDIDPLDSLHDLLQMLNDQPDVILLLEIKSASLRRWGIDFVAQQLLNELDPGHQRHVVLSTSIVFLKAIRERGHQEIACLLKDTRPATREQVEQLAPAYLVIKDQRAKGMALWPGPWQWAIYEVANLEQAIYWSQQDADYVLNFYCTTLHDELEHYKKQHTI